MAQLIPWTRPRGAVHDLNHLLSLSPDHCILLCLSEQELYVLQNWLPLDLEFKSRYAVTLQYNGYEPLDDDHALVPAWLEFVRGFQIGVEDVSCNIETGLNSIAEALTLLAQHQGGGGGGCGSGTVGQVLGCLDGLPNEAFLTSPGQHLTGEPPAGFETWEQFNIYKCAAANWIWSHERGTMVYFRNLDAGAIGTVVLVPILALIFATIEAPPVAAVAAIIGIAVEIAILAGAGWWYLDQMIANWDANREAIVCALFNSSTSDQAAEALVNSAIDAIQSIVSWGALGPISTEIKSLLAELFGQLIGNPNVKPLFEATAVIQQTLDPNAVDCDVCAAAGDCNTQNTLVLGSGTLLPGENILTPEVDGGFYKIDAQLKRGTCVRLTAGPANQIYKLYRCSAGQYTAEYWTGGAPNNVWSCAGRFTLVSDVATPVTLELGADTCGETDGNCP